MPMHDVHKTTRRRELHEQAMAAGVSSPASLALALWASEAEGWRAQEIRTVGAQVGVTLEKVRRVPPRHELAQRIRAERAEGRSLRAIATELEREGIAAPRGGGRWAPSSVRSVGRS